MKKITLKLSLLFILVMSINANAQFDLISMTGAALNGWGVDEDMSTVDGVIYTLDNFTFTTDGAKFRKDHAWAESWGSNAFPAGTANTGDNIPVIAGTYDVTFNLTTLDYSFVSTSTFSDIGIVGTAINGGSTTDENLFTTDGINYFLDAFTVTDGLAHFRQGDAETINWSDSAFPTGTGTQNGTDIAVSAGTYNIVFNINTGVYSFDFVSISLIGDFNAWSGDQDLTTLDGDIYTLDAFVLAADSGLKFRQNHAWGTNWGGDTFPAGTATGNNIPGTAGSYNVTFNRITSDYLFTSTAGIDDVSYLSDVIVFPNVTKNSFKINKTISNLEIFNITGSIVKTFEGSFETGHSFDVSDLTQNMYFVKIESDNTFVIRRLIVK
jgi:hypothetical protein